MATTEGPSKDVTEWRRCEKARDGTVEYWEIRREGIRCRMAWGREGASRRGLTMTLDDEVQAQRHLERKVREKLRKGYVEVAPRRPALDIDQTEEPDGRLFDLMKEKSRYLPVTGRNEVYLFHSPVEGGPGPFREYLLLRDQGRSAVRFVVKDGGARPEDLQAFLDFLDIRRDLAFDGRPHHKIALPAPVGRFTHAMLCSPALGWSEVPGRVAAAFPIFDCEIGDADTEVFVDARIKGRDSLPHSTWNRNPYPVIDLRFDLRPDKAATFTEPPRSYLRQVGKFKVYSRRFLETLVRMLAEATTDSYLEIRSFRGDIKTLRPRDLTPKTAAEIDSFLLGQVY
jgi:predicted DNA-binding WGR domain protein